MLSEQMQATYETKGGDISDYDFFTWKQGVIKLEAAEDYMPEILEAIFNERNRQDSKWGEQNHSDEWWMLILLEEIGELSEALLDAQFGMSPDKPTDARKELVETVAVGIAWLECIDRR